MRHFFITSFTIILFLTLIVQAHASVVEGHVWEFTNYAGKNKINAVVNVDYTQVGIVTVTVTCTYRGETIHPQISGPVVFNNNEITSLSGDRDVKFFSDQRNWCSAEVGNQTLTYTVMDDTHIFIEGDKFFPAGKIWSRVR